MVAVLYVSNGVVLVYVCLCCVLSYRLCCVEQLYFGLCKMIFVFRTYDKFRLDSLPAAHNS